jgi:hypothetical protein
VSEWVFVLPSGERETRFLDGPNHARDVAAALHAKAHMRVSDWEMLPHDSMCLILEG